MTEILCECGHTINWHGSDKCHESLADATCKCQMTPQDIAARLLEEARKDSKFMADVWYNIRTDGWQSVVEHGDVDGIDFVASRIHASQTDPRTPAEIVDDVYAAEVEATRTSDYPI